jgi:predicted RNase H-like HicB family nuclease
MKITVVLHPEEDGGFSVSVPSMPGCYSQGDNREEALANIREAAELWQEVQDEKAIRKSQMDNAEALLQEIEL